MTMVSFTQISNWRASPVTQPLASVYVKFFGQEIGFASIDKAVIDQLIQVMCTVTYNYLHPASPLFKYNNN